MPLPEGRKPLSDKDMIDLLKTLADYHGGTDTETELKQTVTRFQELSSKETETIDNQEYDPEEKFAGDYDFNLAELINIKIEDGEFEIDGPDQNKK